MGTLEKDVFPDLGRRPVTEITAAEVLDVIRAVERRGVVKALAALQRYLPFRYSDRLC